jgi:Domain of unknown function (DUF4116)
MSVANVSETNVRSNKTYKEYLAVVQQNGYELEYVPEELCTPELCLAAVQQNCNALQYVPQVLRTPELYLVAVQQNGYALEHVPQVLRTPELYLVAVQQNGYALAYVPDVFLCQLIVGSRHPVRRCGELVQIGCQVHELDYWLANFERIGQSNRYTLEQIAEYGKHLKEMQ